MGKLHDLGSYGDWFHGGVFGLSLFQLNRPTDSEYYEDPDGIVRPGMAIWELGPSGPGNPTAQSGPNNGSTADDLASRPFVLNRRFRSVAELGVVFRGTPWKNINFYHPTSGDSALLDLFCIEENEFEPGTLVPLNPPATDLVAGRVNLNTRQAKVLEALIKQSFLEEGVQVADGEAEALARGLVDWTSSNTAGEGPLFNVADLVGRFTVGGPFAAKDGNGYAGFSARLPSLFVNPLNQSVASRMASVFRAFIGSTQTRTWNVMIDVIAQSGSVVGGTFVPQGQSRVWENIAIDRFTGEIIDSQTEKISE